MKKNLLILIAICISTFGFSQTVGDTFVDNFITYEVTSISPNEVEITDYNSAGGTVVNIPATTTNNQITYNVTSTGFASFNNKGLTAITIPNSITYIGQQSFTNNSLANVIISNGVVIIGSSSFRNNNITHVTISSTVTNIEFAAFRDNPLATVTSQAANPATVVTGGLNDSFWNRAAIDLTIPAGTSAAYASGGWTGFNSVTEASPLAVGSTFVVDYITYEVTSVSPNTVRTIDYDMAGGTVVDIPEIVSHSVATYSVTAIRSQSFTNKGLTSVSIGENITTIGFNAFYQNQISNEIVIPDSVVNIDARAFDDNLITDIRIGANVSTIEFGAFRNNPLETVISLAAMPPTIITSTSFPSIMDSFSNDRSNINLVITNNTTDEYVTDAGALWTGFKMVFEATSPSTVEVSHYDPANGTNVVIPSTVTAGSNVFDVNRIDDSAFENIGLTSVTIPNSVTNIGISAFNTNNLTSVTIPDSVTIIGTTAFATNPITNLSLGANVADIGIGAFVDNNLTDVTIPSNVTFIGLLAFGGNPLDSVTSLATVPPTITTGTNDTFAFNRSNIHLHIPAGTLGAYVTDPGALWTGFNPVTEDALSVSDFELANNIKVITTSYEIQVHSPNSVILEGYTLYGISGAEISIGTSREISTATLSKGMYIIKLNFDKGIITKKVIIR